MSADFPRRRFIVLMGAALCACAFSPLGVSAEAVKTVSVDGSAQLEAFLSHVSAAEGAFRQRVVDRLGKLVNEAEGIFAFRRPGAFLWNYEKPWKQQVVSDGQTLWLYDEDLMQVTVKKVSRWAQRRQPFFSAAGRSRRIGRHRRRRVPSCSRLKSLRLGLNR